MGGREAGEANSQLCNSGGSNLCFFALKKLLQNLSIKNMATVEFFRYCRKMIFLRMPWIPI